VDSLYLLCYGYKQLYLSNKQISLEHKTRILMNWDLFNIDFRWHGTIMRAVNIGTFVIKILSKEPCVTRYVSYTVLLTKIAIT